MKPLFSGLAKYSDAGLLLMRIGLGAMMIFHGYPKLAGGPDGWAKLGGAMGNLGIHDYPQFWGFMAAFAEGVGGLLILIGLFFRPACLLILITMLVAAATHMPADGLKGASHAIELGIVFLSLFIIGPGRYSVDKR